MIMRARDEKEGASQVLLLLPSFCRLVWSVHRHSEGVAEAPTCQDYRPRTVCERVARKDAEKSVLTRKHGGKYEGRSGAREFHSRLMLFFV